MKHHEIFWRRIAVSVSLAIPAFFAALTEIPLSAQDVEEDVYTLSPFKVAAESDSGYMASQTLAGSRLNTDLKDVASSVSVLTQEFFDDTNSTNANDFLVYVANAEAGGYGGSSVGLTGGRQGDFVTDNAGFQNPGSNQRIRGLDSADLTRDLFLTGIVMDTYNTQRVDIQRGPNAILFGLGSPAGMIDNTLKSAGFYNETKIDLLYGSHDTVRSVVDINREIIEDRLAIRVIGLYEDEKFRQDPAF